MPVWLPPWLVPNTGILLGADRRRCFISPQLIIANPVTASPPAGAGGGAATPPRRYFVARGTIDDDRPSGIGPVS